MFHWVEKNFDHIITPLIILLLVFLAAVACQKEHFRQEQRGTRIIPVLKSVQTKAQDGLLTNDAIPVEPLSERVVASADGFDLIETVYDINTLPYESFAAIGGSSISGGDPETKGTPVTTSSIAAFKIAAYAEGQWHDNTLASGVQGSADKPNSAGLYFKADCARSGSEWSLTKTGGDARTGDAGELYWINDVPLAFWSWNETEPSITSTYVTSLSYTVPSSVSNQKDVLVAFNEEKRTFYEDGEANYGDIKSSSSTGGSTDGSINIRFFHALSAVQFFNGDLSGTYRIKSISIGGVNSVTTCTVTADPSVTPAEHVSNLTFSHSSSTTATFTQSYDSSDASLVRSGSGSNYKSDDTKTFFMIPQTLGSGATVTVTFINGKNEETSSTFSLNGGLWEPGKYYAYKIGLAGAIAVEIGETVTTTAKSDVKFKNIRNVNEYIRAAVVANWFDANGNVVAAWDKTRDGDITLGSGWTENGGFYYHTAAVAAGQETSALFSSFTKPTSAPVTGAHFEMTILAQAVGSDGMTSCTAAFTN